MCCLVLNKGFQIMCRVAFLKSNFCLETQGMLSPCLLYPNFLILFFHLSPEGGEWTAQVSLFGPELW